MGRMSSMRMQSLLEIGGRTATGDEKMVFFCLYVCHAGCPGKTPGHSTTYNVTVVDQF